VAICVQNAIDIISNLTIDLKFEIVPIEDALSRICAKDIYATTSLPKFDNSAMDGYAIIYNDKDNELNIIDTIYAGDNNNKLLENNSCSINIFCTNSTKCIFNRNNFKFQINC
jgi:molybdopterin molybdotransferase